MSSIFSVSFAEVLLRYCKTHISFIDIEVSKAQPYEETCQRLSMVRRLFKGLQYLGDPLGVFCRQKYCQSLSVVRRSWVYYVYNLHLVYRIPNRGLSYAFGEVFQIQKIFQMSAVGMNTSRGPLQMSDFLEISQEIFVGKRPQRGLL